MGERKLKAALAYVPGKNCPLWFGMSNSVRIVREFVSTELAYRATVAGKSLPESQR